MERAEPRPRAAVDGQVLRVPVIDALEARPERYEPSRRRGVLARPGSTGKISIRIRYVL